MIVPIGRANELNFGEQDLALLAKFCGQLCQGIGFDSHRISPLRGVDENAQCS
jgi:hypothetical protein